MGYSRKDNKPNSWALQLIRILLGSLPRMFWGLFWTKEISAQEVWKTRLLHQLLEAGVLPFFLNPVSITSAILPLQGCSQQYAPVPLQGSECGFYKPVLPSRRHFELINGTFRCPELWRAASPEFSCRLMISHKMRSTKLLLPLQFKFTGEEPPGKGCGHVSCFCSPNFPGARKFPTWAWTIS